MRCVMRAFLSLLCCAILAGCVRNSSLLPTALSNGDAQPRIGPTYRTLYSFKGSPDGAVPMPNLVAVNGALYGTTQFGGQTINDGYGTVFEVRPSGTERVLHTFQS